jgi:ABC-type glutathione transport system ATPase component
MSEKTKGIKLFMTVSGLPVSVHVLSWTILNITISAYFSFFFYLLAYAAKFRIFMNVPGPLWMGYFFISSFASNSLAMLISSVASKDKTGYSLAYFFLMFSFVFQVFMTNPNSTGVFYRKRWLLQVVRTIFEFYPGYNYIKIWNDIVHFSGTFFDIRAGRYVAAEGMTWANVTEAYVKFTGQGKSHVPALIDSVWLLFRNIAIFYALIFIFEMTLASNQGVGKNPLVWIKRKIAWFFGILFNNRYNITRLQSLSSSIDKHLSVINEDRLVDEQFSGQNPLNTNMMIVNGLTKVFKSGVICPSSQTALNNVKFIAQKGEILTILGQNGAGKSTLINIVTGYLQPTSGDAFILGHQLTTNITEIRRFTSLCPQSDIYWQELTVLEHLKIFGIIKGITNPAHLEIEAQRLLELVELTEKKDHRIAHLSGGMKRRLSIAISAMGDPQIIIFDEPTNGLDPLKRHAILNLITVK